ncbi:carbonic anhydrase [Noviherbaspirillum pedocola]|uniref:carbonic anhydrase n=1 Tax=Noviherbaspirillum pedocola TaxID=2801341 RepID=A0A934W7U0_9BURK|nr:carbonic anhydrase family protein [Noviherbaspirillum pedocola]MBK4735054.1 carbonic anhydrase family protein [Noviherbaspirillum pedocola]
MKFKLLLVSLSAALASHAALAETHAHWSYQGKTDAAHWSELDEGYATCKLGKHQSPINIETRRARRADLQPIDFAYAQSAAEVVNNGHTIQVNLPEGGKVGIDGQPYQLLQFHFHTPSEEKINGKAYPLVAHMVHKNAEGKLAVVAVLFKQGSENRALKPVFAAMPTAEGEKAALGNGFDAAALLPVNHGYYAYTGSLTTPPCSEEVTWRVLKTPVEVSSAQLAAFKKLYPMNARPVQPLNDRSVEASR